MINEGNQEKGQSLVVCVCVCVCVYVCVCVHMCVCAHEVERKRWSVCISLDCVCGKERGSHTVTEGWRGHQMCLV